MWLHDMYVILSVQYTMTLCMQVLYGVYHVAMVSDLLKYQELSLPCTMTQIDTSLHFSVPIYSALTALHRRSPSRKHNANGAWCTMIFLSEFGDAPDVTASMDHLSHYSH